MTEVLFIGKPYRELKRQVEKETKEEKANTPVFQAQEEEKQETKEKKDNKVEMLKMVTTLLDEKKITKEEADRMIERISEDD